MYLTFFYFVPFIFFGSIYIVRTTKDLLTYKLKD